MRSKLSAFQNGILIVDSIVYQWSAPRTFRQTLTKLLPGAQESRLNS
jgi:hypothetical protein